MTDAVRIGSKVANSQELFRLAREARELEYNHTLSDGLFGRIDPGGTHLLFPEAPAGAEVRAAPPNELGYTKVTSTTLRLTDAVTCKAYLKLKGRSRQNPMVVPFDVSLSSLMVLESVEEAKAAQALESFEPVLGDPDGSTRTDATH